MERRRMEKLKKFFLAVEKIVNLRDVTVFGGIAMMGYGLWMYRPWVAFAVCGAVLSAIGIFSARGKG